MKKIPLFVLGFLVLQTWLNVRSPSELPVAGYFRVSQARDDMKAPELYRDEIDRYCAYKRLRLAEVFSDIDRSGFRGAKVRPHSRSSLADA